MKVISVIPARGGSKGIPLKNLVDIKGKPLIYYSIQSSLKSNVDDNLYVQMILKLLNKD